MSVKATTKAQKLAILRRRVERCQAAYDKTAGLSAAARDNKLRLLADAERRLDNAMRANRK